MATYDPHQPDYLDEAAVRGELTRVFDVCQGCRRCVDLCPSFPMLFDLVDRFDDRDAGNLTPSEQDEVVAACFQCKLCAVGCPYAPGRHDSGVDVPQLMVRANAMLVARGHTSGRQRLATHLVARTSVFGKLSRFGGSLIERMASAICGAFLDSTLAATFGVPSAPSVPVRARQRWSVWFDRRRPRLRARPTRTVTVFPTCVVEYRDVSVGEDLVEVYERNGIGCERTAAGCCGAPWLHAGHVSRFAAVANENVATLAEEIRRRGADVVVPGPTCSYVLRHEYPTHVDVEHRADARFVAEHTWDASEHLIRIHTADDGGLDTDFGGEVPTRVTYHAADHLRAQQIGLPARELIELTGALVELAPPRRDAGAGDGVGAGTPAPAVVGDACVTDPAVIERAGGAPLHPLSVIARAYGVDRS